MNRMTGWHLMAQLVLPHAAATRGHVPLMGLSHDRMACEGLPDLPAARQEFSRPTSMKPSRFAAAPRPDQEGEPPGYNSEGSYQATTLSEEELPGYNFFSDVEEPPGCNSVGGATRLRLLFLM